MPASNRFAATLRALAALPFAWSALAFADGMPPDADEAKKDAVNAAHAACTAANEKDRVAPQTLLLVGREQPLVVHTMTQKPEGQVLVVARLHIRDQKLASDYKENRKRQKEPAAAIYSLETEPLDLTRFDPAHANPLQTFKANVYLGPVPKRADPVIRDAEFDVKAVLRFVCGRDGKLANVPADHLRYALIGDDVDWLLFHVPSHHAPFEQVLLADPERSRGTPPPQRQWIEGTVPHRSTQDARPSPKLSPVLTTGEGAMYAVPTLAELHFDSRKTGKNK